MTANDFLQEAAALQERITAARRTLHQNAEVGFGLQNTVMSVHGDHR